MLAAVALLWAGGCTGGDEGIDDTDTPVVEGTQVTQFTATIASPEVTRATMGGQNAPTWTSGDAMLTLSYNQSAVSHFKSTVVSSSISGVSAQFKTASGRYLDDSRENYALYPYFQAKSADISGGSVGARNIKVALAEQTPSFDDNVRLPLLVGSYDAESQSFTMHNPLLIVRLNLALPADESSFTMKSVDIQSANGEALWGSGATVHTTDMSLELNAEGATSSLTLGGLNEVIDANGKSITFCIPAQQYAKGLSVKIYCLEGLYEATIGEGGIDKGADTVLEADLTLNLKKSDLFVDAVRVTDSTVAIAWSKAKENLKYLSEAHPNSEALYTDDITKDYKVAIYSDKACKQLVYSVSPLKGSKLFTQSSCPPRFIFTGLEPETDYYIHVYNLTDSKQTLIPLEVSTEAVTVKGKVFNYTQPGDIILYENFDRLIYGGDLSTASAGVSRDDRATLTSFDGAELKGEVTLDWEANDISGASPAYIPAAANVEMGLFNTLAGLLDDMGLNEWGWIGGKDGANGGSVCARPGYIKVGQSANRSAVVTPMLSTIPAGSTAKVTIKFKAAPYGDIGKDITPEEREIIVKVLNDTSISTANKITYEAEGESKAITLEGNTNSDWKQYSVTLSNVSSTSRIAISGNRANATDSNRFQVDDICISVVSLSGAFVSGRITYDDGTAASDVVVSDGFSCVKTDINGNYCLTPHKHTMYIFYSVPATGEVMVNNYGQPHFFAKYDAAKTTYNFTLNKIAKEEKFSLFCFADVQCANSSHINRFKNESVPDIVAHAKTKSNPCYGVTLGDVVYSQGTRNCEPIMPTMRSAMAKDKMGMPVFQTFGNHDYSFVFDEANPPACSGYQDLEFQLSVQRAFEEVFGPINYSWNRGDTHIVCMRNMLWWDGASWDHYGDPRFLDAQYEWLKQDLQYVSKDKMVILCVHCSVENSTKSNVQNILKLLSQFKEAHIMSGHHHRCTNFPTTSTVNGKAIYEHNHGAVCGHFWKSRFNADGAPNGYSVYEIEGNKMVDWYYKGVNEGMNSRDYQMRLYRGNLKSGGQYDYIQLQHGANVILANVFNADDNWKIKIYEDGVYAGLMTKMARNNSGPCKYSPDPNNPGKPSTSSSLDWWIVGYHTGVLGLGDPKNDEKHSGNYKDNFHMYKWTLKNANAKDIKVEATDQWGNTYSCSTITGDYDYDIMNY